MVIIPIRKRLIPLLFGSFGLLILGCDGSSVGQAIESVPPSESELVKHSIVTMVNAIDAKQWDVATQQFSKQVFVDYSSLTGQAGAEVKGADLVDGWRNLLAKVDTHHLLGNFEVTVAGEAAEAFSHVYASHLAKGIDYWDAFGRYHHKLEKVNDQWKITSMTLIMHGQKGNPNFLQEVIEMNESSASSSLSADDGSPQKVQFESEGERVVGNLYLPENYDASKDYPAVIVSGSSCYHRFDTFIICRGHQGIHGSSAYP